MYSYRLYSTYPAVETNEKSFSTKRRESVRSEVCACIRGRSALNGSARYVSLSRSRRGGERVHARTVRRAAP